MMSFGKFDFQNQSKPFNQLSWHSFKLLRNIDSSTKYLILSSSSIKIKFKRLPSRYILKICVYHTTFNHFLVLLKISIYQIHYYITCHIPLQYPPKNTSINQKASLIPKLSLNHHKNFPQYCSSFTLINNKPLYGVIHK